MAFAELTLAMIDAGGHDVKARTDCSGIKGGLASTCCLSPPETALMVDHTLRR